jgi:hypothetical protein
VNSERSDNGDSEELRFGDVNPPAVEWELAARLVLAHIDIDPRRCATALTDVRDQGLSTVLRVLMAQTQLVVQILSKFCSQEEARGVITALVLKSRGGRRSTAGRGGLVSNWQRRPGETEEQRRSPTVVCTRKGAPNGIGRHRQ